MSVTYFDHPGIGSLFNDKTPVLAADLDAGAFDINNITRVGVGTATPGTEFEINGTGTLVTRFRSTGNGTTGRSVFQFIRNDGAPDEDFGWDFASNVAKDSNDDWTIRQIGGSANGDVYIRVHHDESLVEITKGLQVVGDAELDGALNHDGTTAGFLGTAPISIITTAVAEASFTENAGGAVVNVDSTFAGYTVQQILQGLQNYGLFT